MQFQKVEAEDFANLLLITLGKIILDDRLWKFFGFNKFPRRMNLFRVFVSKASLAQESFLFREFNIAGIAELARCVRDLVPGGLTAHIVGRVLEQAIDGNVGSGPVWPAYEFESRQAALDFFREGIVRYLRVEDMKQKSTLFIERMKPVVSQKSVGVWIFGGVLLFSEESPIAGVRYWMTDYLKGRSVQGNVRVYDSSFVEIVANALQT